MGVRSSVGRRLSVWKWWEQGAGDITKLDNWPLTPLHRAPPDSLAGGEWAGCPLPKNPTPALGFSGLRHQPFGPRLFPYFQTIRAKILATCTSWQWRQFNGGRLCLPPSSSPSPSKLTKCQIDYWPVCLMYIITLKCVLHVRNTVEKAHFLGVGFQLLGCFCPRQTPPNRDSAPVPC